MANERLLVVDGDARTVRVLEVSLRRKGYSVTAAADGEEALACIESCAPDLLICDTALAKIDGLTLARRLKARTLWAVIPVMFLTRQKATEDRIRALEVGVDDCLVKPVFVREFVARVRLLLDRRLLENLAAGKIPTTTARRFAGSTRDICVADLLQTLEVSRQSGVLHLQNEDEQGRISFRAGQLVEATLGQLRGEEAVYRALDSSEGTFEVEFRPVVSEDAVGRSAEALVLEGLRRESAPRADESVPSTHDEDAATTVTERSRASVRDGGRAITLAPTQSSPVSPTPAVAKDGETSSAGPEQIEESDVPTRVREEPRTEEVELGQWLEEPPQETSAEPSFEHERTAGVPHQIRPATKRIVAAVLGGAMVLLVAGGLRALRARQERLAEASRTPVASTLAATTKPIDVPPPPPTVPAMASAQGGEIDSATTSTTPIGEVPESTANPTASTAPMAAAVPAVAAIRTAAVDAAMARAVVAAPAAREIPVNAKAEPGGGSLVVQASHALAEGAMAHAVDLGRQATGANPGDADAWLTLAAAYQASGNGGAARAAYASCVAQAKTPDISECRVLVGQRSP
ncbi:MAG: response regulator [Polyangiaceae bacterium]